VPTWNSQSDVTRTKEREGCLVQIVKAGILKSVLQRKFIVRVEI
jgi:hypothetical protein